jgi:hypothetical protein
LQGNFTWDKVMLHNAYLNLIDNRLESIQDNNPNVIANIFGIYQFPKFEKLPYYQRAILGGWQLNGVFRDENGPLISAPGTVNIIGNVRAANPTSTNYLNTCYQNTSGVNVLTSVAGSPACDSLTSPAAYQQRLAYTTQSNSPYLAVRVHIKPLMDASLFKKIEIRKGVNFEIRGEFFNVLNSVNFAAPNTTIGNKSFGSVVLTQANDARIGQLTARLNF